MVILFQSSSHCALFGHYIPAEFAIHLSDWIIETVSSVWAMHLFVVDACFRWKCLSQVITSFSVIDEHVGELVDGGGKNDNLSSVGVYWCCNDLLSVGSMLEKDVWMLCVCVQVWVLVCVKERLRQSVCCWIFFQTCIMRPRREARDVWWPPPPCLESQDCLLIPLSYVLFFCLFPLALSVLSFFCWYILLTFSLQKTQIFFIKS